MYEYTPIPRDYPWDWHRKMMADHQRAIPYFLGDYYPLTECSRSPKDWTVYEMHSPELHGGFVMAFRREESDFEQGSFRLKELQAGTYELEDADTGRTWQEDAAKLMQCGLSLHLPDRRSSRLIFYFLQK
jgi:alpha-galactosidase